MHFLQKSNQTLNNLNAYLAEKGLLVGAVRRVVHDEGQDRENLKDPRALAHVRSEPDEIYASKALEYVSDRVRTAIILHEMVHLGLERGRRGGNECEVDVDAWITLHLPEARYGYDTVEYIGTDKRIVIAKNLQVVGIPFAEKVAGLYNNPPKEATHCVHYSYTKPGAESSDMVYLGTKKQCERYLASEQDPKTTSLDPDDLKLGYWSFWVDRYFP